MKNKVIILLCLVTNVVFAQNLKLNVGTNVGMSKLYHNTRFETTPLHDLYAFTAISHYPNEYTWEEFEEDYDIQSSFIQPRFGLAANLMYKDLPIMISVEVMSSPSSYQKISYGAMIGLGKQLSLKDTTYYIDFFSGYKFVKDNGFGATTIVNSIGNDEARDYASTFFNPERPLGVKTGHLFTLRGGIGRDLGKICAIGIEAYSELDLTATTKRQPRMTNFGVNFYIKFKL